MTTVTVLIAVMNMEDTIAKCLNSVLADKYAYKKIFVVDGFSKDNTWAILQSYKERYPELVEIYQVKGAVPVAWNFGFKKIDSEYVAFTDADCVVAQDWIESLLSCFKEKGVIASAGYCGTPENISSLQKVIGAELEGRFKRFPKYISRAPTMNLMVKTKVAKKIMFIERLITASEVDFGHRLTKLGRMAYNPEAQVTHYHRSTLKGFFKQQKNYAHYLFLIYFKLKHPFKGDHISTTNMIWQMPLLEIAVATAGFSLLFRWALIGTLIATTLLINLYIRDWKKAQVDIFKPPIYIYMSFIRTAAWVWESIKGLNAVRKWGV